MKKNIFKRINIKTLLVNIIMLFAIFVSIFATIKTSHTSLSSTKSTSFLANPANYDQAKYSNEIDERCDATQGTVLYAGNGGGERTDIKVNNEICIDANGVICRKGLQSTKEALVYCFPHSYKSYKDPVTGEYFYEISIIGLDRGFWGESSTCYFDDIVMEENTSSSKPDFEKSKENTICFTTPGLAEGHVRVPVNDDEKEYVEAVVTSIRPNCNSEYYGVDHIFCSIVFPYTIESIGHEAFAWNEAHNNDSRIAFSWRKLPNGDVQGIRTIGDCAFAGNGRLGNKLYYKNAQGKSDTQPTFVLSLPPSLLSVGWMAFGDDNGHSTIRGERPLGIECIDFSEAKSLRFIEPGAFLNNKYLKEIRGLQYTQVEKIGFGAFACNMDTWWWKSTRLTDYLSAENKLGFERLFYFSDNYNLDGFYGQHIQYRCTYHDGNLTTTRLSNASIIFPSTLKTIQSGAFWDYRWTWKDPTNSIPSMRLFNYLDFSNCHNEVKIYGLNFAMAAPNDSSKIKAAFIKLPGEYIEDRHFQCSYIDSSMTDGDDYVAENVLTPSFVFGSLNSYPKKDGIPENYLSPDATNESILNVSISAPVESVYNKYKDYHRTNQPNNWVGSLFGGYAGSVGSQVDLFNYNLQSGNCVKPWKNIHFFAKNANQHEYVVDYLNAGQLTNDSDTDKLNFFRNIIYNCYGSGSQDNIFNPSASYVKQLTNLTCYSTIPLKTIDATVGLSSPEILESDTSSHKLYISNNDLYCKSLESYGIKLTDVKQLDIKRHEIDGTESTSNGDYDDLFKVETTGKKGSGATYITPAETLLPGDYEITLADSVQIYSNEYYDDPQMNNQHKTVVNVDVRLKVTDNFYLNPGDVILHTSSSSGTKQKTIETLNRSCKQLSYKVKWTLCNDKGEVIPAGKETEGECVYMSDDLTEFTAGNIINVKPITLTKNDSYIYYLSAKVIDSNLHVSYFKKCKITVVSDDVYLRMNPSSSSIGRNSPSIALIGFIDNLPSKCKNWKINWEIIDPTSTEKKKITNYFDFSQGMHTASGQQQIISIQKGMTEAEEWFRLASRFIVHIYVEGADFLSVNSTIYIYDDCPEIVSDDYAIQTKYGSQGVSNPMYITYQNKKIEPEQYAINQVFADDSCEVSYQKHTNWFTIITDSSNPTGYYCFTLIVDIQIGAYNFKVLSSQITLQIDNSDFSLQGGTTRFNTFYNTDVIDTKKWAPYRNGEYFSSSSVSFGVKIESDDGTLIAHTNEKGYLYFKSLLPNTLKRYFLVVTCRLKDPISGRYVNVTSDRIEIFVQDNINEYASVVYNGQAQNNTFYGVSGTGGRTDSNFSLILTRKTKDKYEVVDTKSSIISSCSSIDLVNKNANNTKVSWNSNIISSEQNFVVNYFVTLKQKDSDGILYLNVSSEMYRLQIDNFTLANDRTIYVDKYSQGIVSEKINFAIRYDYFYTAKIECISGQDIFYFDNFEKKICANAKVSQRSIIKFTASVIIGDKTYNYETKLIIQTKIPLYFSLFVSLVTLFALAGLTAGVWYKIYKNQKRKHAATLEAE